MEVEVEAADHDRTERMAVHPEAPVVWGHIRPFQCLAPHVSNVEQTQRSGKADLHVQFL